MLRKITYLFFGFFMVLISSCRNQNGDNQGNQITLEVPDNFSGIIFIEKSIDRDKRNIGDKFNIVIPESGIASTANYGNFRKWHQINVRSKLGTNPHHHLYGLGEVDGHRMVYFFGTDAIYERRIRRASISDLKPGRMSLVPKERAPTPDEKHRKFPGK